MYHRYVPEMWSEIPGTVKIILLCLGIFKNILSDLVEVSGIATSCYVCEVEDHLLTIITYCL